MIGTVGIVSLVIDNPVNWAIKNIGLFKTSQNNLYKYFVLNYLKSIDVKNYIDQHLAGSTQKYISLTELRNLPIKIPEISLLQKYNDIVEPIYEQIINTTNEIKKLISLRDTLLPKLMNGEIEIDEVGK
jgi:type I restriction enzyme S subunit